MDFSDPLTLWLFVGGVTVFAIGFGVLIHHMQEPCPSCQGRGTLRWRHAKKNGGPDLRYNENARICRSCGWASDIKEKEAAQARVAAILDAHMQKLQQLNSESVDKTMVSFICLLSYIATADRQFTEAEKNAMLASEQQAFPGRWPDASVIRWIDTVTASDTPDAYVQHLDVGIRPQAWQLIERIASADGKVTPAEKRRLKEVQAALGVPS